MSKHTEGPWEIIKACSEYWWVRARGKNISGTVTTIHIAWAHADQQEEQKANAILIAAAPELLEALNGAMHALRSYQYGNASKELAKSTADACAATISKATA